MPVAAVHPGVAGEGSARPHWAKAGWFPSWAHDHADCHRPRIPHWDGAGPPRRKTRGGRRRSDPRSHRADSRRGHIVALFERLEAGSSARRCRRAGRRAGRARAWRRRCRSAARPRSATRANSTMGRVRRERAARPVAGKTSARPGQGRRRGGGGTRASRRRRHGRGTRARRGASHGRGAGNQPLSRRGIRVESDRRGRGRHTLGDGGGGGLSRRGTCRTAGRRWSSRLGTQRG